MRIWPPPQLCAKCASYSQDSPTTHGMYNFPLLAFIKNSKYVPSGNI